MRHAFDQLNVETRRRDTQPIGIVDVDPYSHDTDEMPTIVPPPSSSPGAYSYVAESGVHEVQHSDLVAENVQLRMLLRRVQRAKLSEMSSVIAEIGAAIGE